jgi:hypothetical protein
MTTQNFCSSTRSIVWLLAICMTLALSTLSNSTAHAGAISFAKVDWQIAAKEVALIEHDMMDMMGAMWDVPAQRRAERNMPWVQVTNDANSDANLTEFRMTIGDERFHFSNELFVDYAIVSATSPFQNVSSTTANSENELVLTFNGGGIAPGDSVRFKIDLGIDADQLGLMQIWPHPDYRTVLFDMNGIDAWGPTPMTPMAPDDSDNSAARATFTSMGMTVTTPAPGIRFPDATVVGPQAFIFNQFKRPQHVMEDVDVFNAVEVIGAIPEPSSLLLSVIGMSALGLLAQRRSATGRRALGTPSVAYRRQNDPRPQRQIACRHRMNHRATR